MSAAENKRLMQEVFAQLANGNSRPFIESLAEDVRPTEPLGAWMKRV